MPSEIWKRDASTWRVINELEYMDGATPRDITEVYYNDSGVWRQVFGAGVAAETLAWSTSAPSGDYFATDLEVGVARSQFNATTLGAFNFEFDDIEAPGSTGSPTSGTYRPGATGADTTNYEYNISAGSVTGNGTVLGVNGTDISGTWQPLTFTIGVSLVNLSSTSGTVSITVEIREIATPANTTGVASFSLSATGAGAGP